MSKDSDATGEVAWRLLAEFARPIDLDTSDQIVARVVSAAAELHLPEARLRQVRQLAADAIQNRVGQQAITIRVFVAQPDEHALHDNRLLPGWGCSRSRK